MRRETFVVYPHREYLGGDSSNRGSRFMIDDKVSYDGSDETLQRKFGGKLGVIVARVGNCASEYVVNFGSDDIILEERELRRARSTDKEPEVNNKKRRNRKEEE
jgi:hypothetical protein